MHMQSNNDEKKYRFFDPFTGEAPLKQIKTIKLKYQFHLQYSTFKAILQKKFVMTPG